MRRQCRSAKAHLISIGQTAAWGVVCTVSSGRSPCGWCSVGWRDPNENGVRCYNAGGELLGKIHIPETVANLCFGGQQRNRLYICGSTSLYAVYTSAQGAMKP
jgi:sugar lactone lactonase YvrE